MSNQMREEFEAAIAKESGQPLVAIQLSRMADSYSTSVLVYAWWAWKASREVIVIELPRRYEIDSVDGIVDREDGPIIYAGDIRAVIEAAGLKVKP